MKFLYNENHGIRHQAMMGFLAILLVFLVSAVITIVMVTTARNAVDNFNAIRIPSYFGVLDIEKGVHQVESSLRGVSSSQDKKYEAELVGRMKFIEIATSKVDPLVPFWTAEKNKQRWSELKVLLNELSDKQKLLLNSAESKGSPTALINETSVLIQKILLLMRGANDSDVYDGLIGGLHEQAVIANQQIISDMHFLNRLEYGLIILGIILSLLLARNTTKKIVSEINKFRDFTSKVASGDFSEKLTITSEDEVGRLGQDFNVMTDKLATITKQTTTMCVDIVSMLEQAKRAADAQASGSSEQASSIQQITSSLGEIEQSSAQTLEQAKVLGASAQETEQKGEQGLQAVEQSMQGMRMVREKVQNIAQTILDLSVQTQQVGEITAVVNGLAQQSKMLALNASIEAAKAGESGKGFAVVAAEMKSLAEQSEQSTTQVQKILEDIRHATEKAVLATEEGTVKVDQGTELTEKTGHVVKSLSEMISSSQIIAQQIQASILQEHVGIEQITAGMNEINQVTSSFLETIQQSNEAIENLRNIARDLRSHVDTYKV